MVSHPDVRKKLLKMSINKNAWEEAKKEWVMSDIFTVSDYIDSNDCR